MLRPQDLAVLLYLVLQPLKSYGHLAAMLGISKGSAHAAVARLIRSGLVHRVGRDGAEAATGPALEFLQFGAAYAFAPDTVPRARGVPTGFLALADSPLGEPLDVVPAVWPSQLGETMGMGVTPLVRAAPDIRLRDPRLYHLLALVDALRLGDARERELARAGIREAVARARG